MSRHSSMHALYLTGVTFLLMSLLPCRSLAQNDGYLNNSNTRGLEAMNSFQIAPAVLDECAKHLPPFAPLLRLSAVDC